MEMRFSDAAQPIPGQLPVFGFQRQILSKNDSIPVDEGMDFVAATTLLKGRVLFCDLGGHIIECPFKEFQQRYKLYPPTSAFEIPERMPNTSWALHRACGNVAPFQMDSALRQLMSISGKERLFVIQTFKKCFNDAMRTTFETLFERAGGTPSRRTYHRPFIPLTATSSA